jgi:hypothetical protein
MVVSSNDNDTRWSVSLHARGPRHWSSIRKQLSFMTFVSYNETKDIKGELTDILAQFSLDRPPSSQEAETIRKLLALKKKPVLSDERKEAMRQGALRAREKKASISKSTENSLSN